MGPQIRVQEAGARAPMRAGFAGQTANRVDRQQEGQMSGRQIIGAAAVVAIAGAGTFGIAGGIAGGTAQANSNGVIELTQVGCQFIESENGRNHGYTPTKKADCVAINGKTADKRLGEAKVLELKPGNYTFRVVNKSVPYELGFWLRSKGYDWRNPVHKLTKTSVSGGGLVQGTTKDYQVTLKPGEYVYSCPLNTTPDYKLVVK